MAIQRLRLTGWQRLGHVLASLAVAIVAWSVLAQVLFVAMFVGRDPFSVWRYDMVLPPFGSLQSSRAACLVWLVVGVVVTASQLVVFVRSARGFQRRAWDWIPLVMPLVLGAALFVVAFVYLPGNFLPRIATQRGFERMSGMKLPAETVFIEARGFKGFKQTVQARVRMPRAALRPFLDSGFTAPVAVEGHQPPVATLQTMRREQLRQWPIMLFDDWPPPPGDRLLVATATDFAYGDSVEVLAVADTGDGPMVEVTLQFVRG